MGWNFLLASGVDRAMLPQRTLEVRTFWGDSLLDASVVISGQTAYFEGVTVEPEPLEENAFVIDLPERFSGCIEKSGARVVLERSMLPYTIGNRESVVLSDGRIQLELRTVEPRRLKKPRLLEDINYRWLNIFMIAFFVHAVLIVAFFSSPLANAELTDQLLKRSRRFIEARLVNPPPAKKPASPGWTVPGKSDSGGGGVSRKSAGVLRRGTRDGNVDAKSTLAALFGGGGSRSVFGSGSLGDGLENALGDVRGRDVEAGLSGFGTRGEGPGQPGFGGGSIGPGELRGVGGIGGDFGEGEGRGRMVKSAASELVIDHRDRIRIEGSLPKEVIHAVIQQNIPQIRYCYERELIRSPGLFGKISTEFVIAASGQVASAKVVQSTVGNDAFEGCVVERIKGWVFPKPRGGGEVTVKYPFVFRPAG